MYILFFSLNLSVSFISLAFSSHCFHWMFWLHATRVSLKLRFPHFNIAASSWQIHRSPAFHYHPVNNKINYFAYFIAASSWQIHHSPAFHYHPIILFINKKKSTILPTITRDRGSTRSASTRRRVGDRFESRPGP